MDHRFPPNEQPEGPEEPPSSSEQISYPDSPTSQQRPPREQQQAYYPQQPAYPEQAPPPDDLPEVPGYTQPLTQPVQPGSQPFYGTYPASTFQPRRRRRGCIIGCLVALIILMLLCGGAVTLASFIGFGLGNAFRTNHPDPALTYPVGTNPTLIINNQNGSISVNPGNADTITVRPTRFASFGGSINNVHISYDPNTANNTVTISVTVASNYFNSSGVDFALSVPPTTNLRLNTKAGDITIAGIQGSMSLLTNFGTVGATRTTLTGSSSFKTNAGNVNFNGSFASNGTYDFETKAGNVTITLPATAVFHVNASTDAGSITTGFPISVQHSAAGANINADVGTSPQAVLTLKTNAGSITLNKA